MSEWKAIIIHGTYGSPNENWFPWLAEQLESKGVATMRPTLPTPEHQSLATWRKEFHDQLGALSPNTVLVGHSLAPAFILDLLQSSAAPIAGTFLVSGFLGLLGLPDFDILNESFVVRDDFDWQRIRANAGHVSVYNSDNDPYVPLARGRELARLLETELRIVHDGGHINSEAGFSSFPLLLEDIEGTLGL